MNAPRGGTTSTVPSCLLFCPAGCAYVLELVGRPINLWRIFLRVDSGAFILSGSCAYCRTKRNILTRLRVFWGGGWGGGWPPPPPPPAPPPPPHTHTHTAPKYRTATTPHTHTRTTHPITRAHIRCGADANPFALLRVLLRATVLTSRGAV
jgi:hypothetical protein